MDFVTATAALLDYVRRPASELGAAAKLEINAACLWANRNHDFKYAEGFATVVYPLQTEYITLSDICDATILNLICVELLPPGVTTQTSGIPLKIKQYQAIQSERLTKNNNASLFLTEYGCDSNSNQWELEYATRVQQDFRYFVTTIATGFGLWPVAQRNENLKLLFNKKLPWLVNDSDTNFLLENCWDFILLRALKRFNIYLKEDNRVPITNEELGEEWDSILEWDAKIRTIQY